jgi:U1 small nuclear ribonucleoprotein 70kDa
MTDKLGPLLLPLFAPRKQLLWAPHMDHAPAERHTAYISGVAQYMQALKDYKDPPGWEPTESWLERKDRVKREKKEKHEKLLTEGVASCMEDLNDSSVEDELANDGSSDRPAEDPNITGDPYRTLFVARLSYDVEPKDLEREFGRYGPIERVSLLRFCISPLLMLTPP